jgi:cyclin A
MMWQLQDDIQPRMRLILVDWLFEVSLELKLAKETFFLTVNYLDR